MNTNGLVQCDEARPSCHNCLRGRRHCSYTRTRPLISSNAATISSDESGNIVDCNRESLQPFPQPSQSPSPRQYPGISRSQELYLMHHYATVTWSTLANIDSPEEVYLWKVAIPREAMDHEFLMDALLAVSSLHLAHLEPSMSRFYTTAGVEYQTQGLCNFKTALNDISGDNVNALFAFSIIVTVLAFAIPATSHEDSDSTPADSLQSIFELLRGVGVISNTAGETIRTGMFKILLEPHGGPHPSCDITCDSEVQGAMAMLRERAGHLAKYVGPVHHQVYISCIQSLETSFEHISAYRSVARAIAWPVLVSDRLMVLFQQKDPMAQLIWVHYGVLLLYIHDRWWGRGFAIRLIESLSDSIHSVDREWAVYTQWPRERAKIASQRAEGAC